MIGMAKFVGPEYLVGNAFLYFREQIITIEDIEKYRSKMQEYWNSHDINAVLTGRIDEYELSNFNDYFQVVDSVGIIILGPETSYDDLRRRFEYTIPIELSETFEIVAKQMS